MNTKTTCASAKKLIELRSGYSGLKYGIDPNTGQIVAVSEHEKGIGAHFKRNAATYAGTALGAAGTGAALGSPLPFLAGVLGGGIIDKVREGRAMNRIIQDQAGKELRRRESVGMSAREQLDTILFARGDMISKLFRKMPITAPVASAIEDAVKYRGTAVARTVAREAKVSRLPMGRKMEERYRLARIGMSAKDELNTILFANDPRPRDSQGQFTDANGNMIDPNSIHAAYKQQMQQGQPPQQEKPEEEEQDKPEEEESKLKKLISKLKKKESNMKQTNMSARDQLDRIISFADQDRLDSRAKGAAIGGALGLWPGAALGYGAGSGFGKNKKEKLSNRDKAFIIGGGVFGAPGVLGAHVLADEGHKYSAREQLNTSINFEVDDANAGKRARMAALKYKLGTDIQAASDRAASYGQMPGALGGAYLGFRGRGTLGATLSGATIGTVAGGLLGRVGSASNERKRIKTMLADAKGQ